MAIGRVSGHRGGAGELTVRVRAGDAERWVEAPRVWLHDGTRAPRSFDVRAARAYSDRLVLALEGIDDPSDAAALRGLTVEVADDDRPLLADGDWQPEDIEGLAVIDEAGRPIGTALGIWPTGGVDLLRVRAEPSAADDEELLVPLADDYVRAVRVGERCIIVNLPDDLRTLNSPADRRRDRRGA